MQLSDATHRPSAISLNDNVAVRLNGHGLRILRDYYKNLSLPQGPVLKPPVDEMAGRFQLHHLMHIFGPHMIVGSDHPFEDFTVL